MEGAADPNSKDALWSLLGRQSKVGRKLFNLYYQGSQNGNDIGNLFSERNKALYRKKLASGATPPPKEPKPKPVPKSRAFVEVPPPCLAQPPPPTLMPSGGKKSLASIQAETATFAYPPLEPKGPVLGEREKDRLALIHEHNGELPAALRALLQEREQAAPGTGQGGCSAALGPGSVGGARKRAELRAMVEQLGEEVKRKGAAARTAGSEAEADRLRREMRQDLAHARRLDELLARLEAL